MSLTKAMLNVHNSLIVKFNNKYESLIGYRAISIALIYNFFAIRQLQGHPITTHHHKGAGGIHEENRC